MVRGRCQDYAIISSPLFLKNIPIFFAYIAETKWAAVDVSILKNMSFFKSYKLLMKILPSYGQPTNNVTTLQCRFKS